MNVGKRKRGYHVVPAFRNGDHRHHGVPGLLFLFFFYATLPLQAAKIGDVVQTDLAEQAIRFFTFKDPSLRYALLGSLLLGISCGLLGSFIVVRKIALMGDALSHAVLPGVAAGFLWNSTKDPLAIFVGATLAGLLGTLVVTWIKQTTKLKEDAALGMVLASFFAVGICLITMIQKRPTGHKSGVDKFLFGQAAALSQQDIILMLVTTLLSIAIISILYKGFLVASFDAGFARAIGFPVKALHHLLMLLLAFSIVVALQAVGVVLVSAMLITPAAAAYLLTDRMHRMLVLSALFGMFAGAVGAFLSFWGNNMPTGPFMVMGASAVFMCAFLFSPRHGIVIRSRRHQNRTRRIQRENMLKSIYRVLEDRDFKDEGVSLTELAQARREPIEDTQKYVADLVRLDDLTLGENDNLIYFTPASYQHACIIVRNHRLWELYLTNEAHYAADHVHEDAEKIEHILGEETVRLLEKKLRHPRLDPHGKPIPGIKDVADMTPAINRPGDRAATGCGERRL